MNTAEVLRKVRRLEIRSRHLVEDLFAGGRQSVFQGRGIEFEEVRPYLPGDEVRSIDWNVTARLGDPYVKRFVEERELTVLLVVDVSRSMRRMGAAGRLGGGRGSRARRAPPGQHLVEVHARKVRAGSARAPHGCRASARPGALPAARDPHRPLVPAGAAALLLGAAARA